MPLGLYLSFLFKLEGKTKVFLLIFFISLMIETVQLSFTYLGLIMPRGFNVDDLIMNSFGGYLAFVLCEVLKKTIFDKRLGNME